MPAPYPTTARSSRTSANTPDRGQSPISKNGDCHHFVACLLFARGCYWQSVDAAHFVVAHHRPVGEKSFREPQRVGTPEYFAVDHERRHAEDAARRGFGGVLAQRILDVRGRERLLGNGEVFAQPGK